MDREQRRLVNQIAYWERTAERALDKADHYREKLIKAILAEERKDQTDD